jgi:DNA-binding NtrC family response regulator
MLITGETKMLLDQKVRVLIVDDDPSIVKLLGRFAEDLCFETLEAVRPTDALALASREQVDIAVIDLHMPEMEGIELMKSLRRINDEIQVILITGDHSSDSVSAAIENGAYDYIWKPIDFRQLSDSLKAVRDQVLRRGCSARRPAGVR